MEQSALPLGPYDPAGPMVLEVSVVAKNAVRAYGELHKVSP